ncbi:hypothetical protein [Ereboglobus luteus]|uniref:hypothetical protein n=1 Tax=Ereboglobus luteus TaxID=1796921 RepID=UPI0012601EA3|nr:hypothetical protein [Ereboglobus luteus]
MRSTDPFDYPSTIFPIMEQPPSDININDKNTKQLTSQVSALRARKNNIKFPAPIPIASNNAIGNTHAAFLIKTPQTLKNPINKKTAIAKGDLSPSTPKKYNDAKIYNTNTTPTTHSRPANEGSYISSLRTEPVILFSLSFII